MNTKRLHLHAVPVILFAIGLFYISIFGLVHLLVVNPNSDSLTSLIGAHLYSIRPASDGFFHISRDFSPTETQANEQTASQSPPAIGQTFMAGQVTELQAALSQAPQTVVETTQK